MFLSLVNRYLIKNYYALHIHMDEKGPVYNVLHIHKNKGAIKISDQVIANDFDALLQKLKKNVPVVISFTGKKIINKAVTNEPNYLDKVLFNQDPEAFYIREQVKEEKVLISLARKAEINELLENFNKNSIGIIDFSIGPYILENVKNVLPGISGITTEYFSYNIATSEIGIQNQETAVVLNDFTIGGETIKNSHIVAFAAFLQYVNKDLEATNFETLTFAYGEEFAYRKAFSVLGIGMVAFFLTSLLISYLLISAYSEKSAGIQQELAIHNQYVNQIETLKKDKDYKQSIINNSSLGSSEFLSFYISGIAETLPKEITLEELSMFPLKAPLKPDDKIAIVSDKIMAVGTTASKNSVNDWIAALSKLPWIKKTEIVSYTFVKNEYAFTLTIFL